LLQVEPGRQARPVVLPIIHVVPHLVLDLVHLLLALELVCQGLLRPEGGEGESHVFSQRYVGHLRVVILDEVVAGVGFASDPFLYIYPDVLDRNLVYLGEVLVNIMLRHLHGAVESDHVLRLRFLGTRTQHCEVGQEHPQGGVAALVQGVESWWHVGSSKGPDSNARLLTIININSKTW